MAHVRPFGNSSPYASSERRGREGGREREGQKDTGRERGRKGERERGGGSEGVRGGSETETEPQREYPICMNT